MALVDGGLLGDEGANVRVLRLKQFAERNGAFRVARRAVDDQPRKSAERLRADAQGFGKVRLVEELQDVILPDFVLGKLLRSGVDFRHICPFVAGPARG